MCEITNHEKRESITLSKVPYRIGTKIYWSTQGGEIKKGKILYYVSDSHRIYDLYAPSCNLDYFVVEENNKKKDTIIFKLNELNDAFFFTRKAVEEAFPNLKELKERGFVDEIHS